MYKELLKQSKTVAISGSHALILQGFKLEREPVDIDIFDPIGNFIPVAEGLKEVESDFNLPPSRVDSDVLRSNYLFNGVSVDIFFCANEKRRKQIESNIVSYDGVRCVHWKDILDFKLQYTFDKSESAEKHRQDLIYFFTNNKEVRLPLGDLDLPF